MENATQPTIASDMYMSQQTDVLQETSHSHRMLPTRVNKACQRCRRHKIRCDTYRPCSLCVRANSPCMSAPDIPHPSKKLRLNNTSTDSEAPSQADGDTGSSGKRGSRQEQPSLTKVETSQLGAAHMSPEDKREFFIEDSGEYQEVPSALGITRKIFGIHGRNVVDRTTSAIPDGEMRSEHSPAYLEDRLRQPISAILGNPLPSKRVMDMLLDEYFDAVHWFSLVIYEPRFRPEYDSIADGYAYPSQKGFLILLATVLGIAAWYHSKKSHTVNNTLQNEDWDKWRVNLLSLAEACFLGLMDESSLASIQTCSLLGSYYVYHGRPNSSFALLGATIKIAQAMGLHREPSRGSSDEIEERKRVWWTIYTWDRFASVTYGRPLGINDNDCNVTMPSDVYERARPGTADDDTVICYSAYQRQLNMLYAIVSPLIETIFGVRSTGTSKRNSETDYSTSLQKISHQLGLWRAQVPPNLLFNFDQDIEPEASLRRRAHQLQALALQLTYDNILIILHRPVLVQQIDSLRRPRLVSNGKEKCGSTPPIPSQVDNLYELPTSSQQWWNAAVRTSGVTTLPNTVQLATDSHLVAFMAIILFNAAIVMVVCALSDPLSDRAQEAKRNITRVFRLEEFLGQQSTLSRQSSIVLQDVIQLLLERETEVMLAPLTTSKARSAGPSVPGSPPLQPITVEEVLRDFIPETKLPDLGIASVATNETILLNESLASVQKVFPGFNSGSISGANVESSTYESSSGIQGGREPFQGNSMIYATDPYRGMTVDYGGVDSGLYWIWDLNTDYARDTAE
ncbi:fungal-specific transcription factor domain-containing protein [Lipomyces kononenkoae]|uniref:Fungal-specific transcription factor domain-containing protein n=1 Tax=Lipomyces kononenkoae TaxID=34357 RepID=A0ACC3SW96_LIPKO